MSDNPLLHDFDLPAFDSIRPEHVEPAIETLIAACRAAVDAVVADTGPRDWNGVMAAQEDTDDRLSRAWAPVSHLHSVMDSPALREVYAEALDALTELSTDIGQNRELYHAVRALREGPHFATLDPAQRKIVDDELRDFRLSGVALEEPARSRFKAIATELARLDTDFEQAVLDATDAWTRDVSLDALAGLPESSLALLKQSALDAGVAGYRITLKHPSYNAIVTYADDRALREALYTAYSTRASDQGPHAGRFDNSERLEKIMALRHEAAQLIGFDNAAQESVATKMAGDPQHVLTFLRDLAARARPLALRELDELQSFARDSLGLDTLQPWDTAYVAEKLRQARYALSEEELKPYFPVDAALGGLFAVAEHLFGVRFAARSDVAVWHPDVRYYDLIDADGRVFAGAYLDLYARSAKRGGAWMDVCRTRRRHAAGLQHPVAFLTCNFAPPSDGLPALLTHDDVITLFHEFGHGLHHLLTEVDYTHVAGISGVEWDAVELPSQFMENFCWTRAALDMIARHHVTGEKLPDDLYRRLVATRHFQAGLYLLRQLEFALFDFRLHLDYDPAHGARVLDIMQEVRREVAVLHPPAWQRMAHSFTHIFAGGYAAGYYSYLWAEVLSADAFARFEDAGILDRDTGLAFRREVLAVGGSRPALESFIAFRGREPDSAALLKSYGLAA